MQTQSLVSVVIVTRDRSGDLQKCLESVSAQHYANTETLVVDNGSVDGTVKMLAHDFPEVRLIRLDRNLGCPGARNVGALNARGEILFFLDDDCCIDPDAIDHALPYFLADPKLAVITPRIIEPESESVRFVGGDSMRYVHSFIGFSAIRRSTFDDFGLYPADFLYGAEETDLAIRILHGGGRILYVPQVIVFHYPSKKRDRNWEMEHALLNGTKVLLKYAPVLRLLGGILIKPLTFLPQAIHRRSLWGWLKAFIKIPIVSVTFLASGQRRSLGWQPFLLAEYLANNSITSLEEVALAEKKQLKVGVLLSRFGATAHGLGQIWTTPGERH